jgi:hypothetical protein
MNRIVPMMTILANVPARGVLTPISDLMADLVKEPVVGIDPKKEPTKLVNPPAKIS